MGCEHHGWSSQGASLALVQLWPAFPKSSSLLYLEITFKISNTSTGSTMTNYKGRWPWPVYQWVLAKGQSLGHPRSPGRKEEVTAGDVMLCNHLCLTTSAASSHFSTLSKNLLICFWKSCKKLNILCLRHPYHLPDKGNINHFFKNLELLQSNFWFFVPISLIPLIFPLLGNKAVLKSTHNHILTGYSFLCWKLGNWNREPFCV